MTNYKQRAQENIKLYTKILKIHARALANAEKSDAEYVNSQRARFLLMYRVKVDTLEDIGLITPVEANEHKEQFRKILYEKEENK